LLNFEKPQNLRSDSMTRIDYVISRRSELNVNPALTDKQILFYHCPHDFGLMADPGENESGLCNIENCFDECWMAELDMEALGIDKTFNNAGK
jgi:hypothetical protein